MSHKTLIISTVLLLIVSFLSLAYIEQYSMDPDRGKNWWVLAFSDPQSKSADFAIENHSDETHFSYQVLEGQARIKEDSLDIPKGQSRTVSIDRKSLDQKITVQVQASEKDKKEIYKN